ncbi:hypothetical protein DRE_00399 [Drechslerella stenobrocha 248]|uniref:Amidohydrolase 3 domain-containing protein n=1 Tax=Drechslerella stenobrocha 248 TaxID=1043628 RepID=W7HTH7_9PEZI|nr:hypothetical protein DRE_00399 [Drechslerella stenobrocha 248]
MKVIAPPSVARFIVLALSFAPLLRGQPVHSEEEGSTCLSGHLLGIYSSLIGTVSFPQFDVGSIKRKLVGGAVNVDDTDNKSDDAIATIFYSNSPTNRNPIITMAGDKLSAVEAIAVKDGKVLATGRLWYLKWLTWGKSVSQDIGSGVILPGFVEPHLHILLSAFVKGYLLDISPLRAPSFAAAMEKLRSELPNVKPDEWLVAHGYDPSRLSWQALLMEVIDREVSSTVPILVLDASGHLAYANSKAFALANVTEHTPDPEGGEYARGPDGKLTGVLVEAGAINHFATVAKTANTSRQDKIKEGFAKVFAQWLAKGVTTVLDAGLGISSVNELDIIANLTEVSPIRIRGAVADYKPGDAKSMLGTDPMPPGGFKKKNLTVRTVKLFSDGSTQGFTAAVKHDYLLKHFPAYFHNRTRGVLVWPDAPQSRGYNVTLRDEIYTWMNKGYQIMVHSNGDRASDMVLDAYASIFAQYPHLHPKVSGITHRIEHFTVTERAQVRRARELGLAVSHTMGHVHFWGDIFRDDVLGSDRAERIDPVADGAADGLVYSFNSDSPVTDVDPLLWVRTAITRRVYGSGDILGRRQRVGLEEALRGVTSYPAKQILLEAEVGKLEAGKNADFVVVSEDVRVFDWDSRQPGELRVLQTWVGGVKRFDATTE